MRCMAIRVSLLLLLVVVGRRAGAAARRLAVGIRTHASVLFAHGVAECVRERLCLRDGGSLPTAAVRVGMLRRAAVSDLQGEDPRSAMASRR